MKHKIMSLWQSSLTRFTMNLEKSILRNYHSKSNAGSNAEKVLSGLGDSYPKTAIGVSEFKKLVSGSTVFIDKTLLIKDFFEDSHETVLTTFPRRWGKSINLDMIKTFFGIQVDSNGNKINGYGDNYKFFFGNRDSLEPLNISKVTINKVEEHKVVPYKPQDLYGQYPVIHIDLKNTKGNSYDEVLNRLKSELYRTFSGHKYLEESKQIKENEISLFQKYTDPLEYKKLTSEEVTVGLLTLTKLLSQHFGGKKVMVLMDEYDAAINHSYISFDKKESDKVIDLFRNINETTFKSNEYLEKGLITGVFRIAKANLFSGLNNLGEYGIHDREFSRYYGFTQEEVDFLFNCYKIPEYLAQSIKEWYNGYNIGGIQIYNPWSIVKCLNKFQHSKDILDSDLLKREILQSYWEESGNIDFVKELFKVPLIKGKVDRLVQNEPLVFNLKKQISSNDYNVLKQLIDLGSNYSIDESAAELLFSYLFSAGYLTTGESGSFKLPNHEIKTELQGKLLEYYKQYYNIDTRLFTNVTDQLQKFLDSKNDKQYQEAAEAFKDSLGVLLAKFPEFTKINDSNIQKDSKIGGDFHGNEDLIHSVMSYITLQLKSLSKFGTEIYLGQGRADIMLIDGHNNKAAIIELKYNEKNATTAIEQIQDKQYSAQLIEKYQTVYIGVNVTQDKQIDIQYKNPVVSYKGQGSKEDSYSLPYNSCFNEYRSEDIETILPLRIKSLKEKFQEKIKILPARYQLGTTNTDIDKVVQDVHGLEVKDNDIVLVPYNIGNEHWVGIIFKKYSKGFKVVYLDSENKIIEPRLLLDLKKELEQKEQKLVFNQELVEKQKYNNCGSEVIENFIYYLTGNRIEDSRAVIYHSQLIESTLKLNCSNKIYEKYQIEKFFINEENELMIIGDIIDSM